jgi:Domain of unknown function (DUF4129)
VSRNKPVTIGLLCVGGMEVCWMASALWLLEARTVPEALPVPWLMLGVPLAFFLRRLARNLSRSLRPIASLAGGLVWTLLLIRFSAFPEQALTDSAWIADLGGRLIQGQGGPNPLQLTGLAAAATWVGGLRLAAMRVGFDQILSEFQFGLLILLFIFFCAAQWGNTLPALTPMVFVFFTLSLLGMALARNSDASTWRSEKSRAYRLTAIVFNIALILGVGVLLTAAVTPGALKLILGFLEALWDWMVEWVVRFIAFLASILPQPEISHHPIAGGSGPGPRDSSSIPELLRIPDYIRRIAGFIVSAFWVVLFGVCLWRMASQIAGWLRQQMNDMEGTEIETLEGAFRHDLLRLLRWIRQRLTGWIVRLRYALGWKPVPEKMPTEAAAVRRLYRALLTWSAAGGCPRKRHQTPHEFLGRLGEWLPEARAKLTLITEHYVAVRYGNRAPGADVAKSLELTWQDVRRMRKRRRKEV